MDPGCHLQGHQGKSRRSRKGDLRWDQEHRVLVSRPSTARCVAQWCSTQGCGSSCGPPPHTALHWGLTLFSHRCDRVPDNGSLGRKALFWLTVGGRSPAWWEEFEAAGCTAAVREEGEGRAGIHLTSSLLVLSSSLQHGV